MNTLARSRGEQVVRELDAAGLIAAERHDEAVRVVDRALDEVPQPHSPLRRRLPEIGGYLGAAFVTAAVVLLVSRPWDELTTAAQVALLVTVSGLLLAAAFGLARATGGMASLRAAENSVRRRMASTVATAGAAAGGAAALVASIDLVEEDGALQLALVGIAFTFTALAFLGYALAPTLLGQIATAVGAAYTVQFVVLATPSPDIVLSGLAFVALGALWLVLAERGWWREPLAARVIGLALLFIGAQVPLAEPASQWVAYLLTTLVAAAGFWLYAAREAWPYLTASVVAATVVVPEAVLDWTNGSTLGAGTALLAAGATLLAASLLGQRLRRRHPPEIAPTV